MREHQDLVYGTAMRLLGGDASDAEDMSQQVFLKAYEKFETISESPQVRGWLKTVTTNFCLNHLKRYRSRWRMFSDMRTEDEGEFVDTLAGPDEAKALSEGMDRKYALEQALQKLPEAQRVPLVLFHFEDMSYDEIARRMGVTTGKIKIDIHRGRMRLRNIIEMPGVKGGEPSISG